MAWQINQDFVQFQADTASTTYHVRNIEFQYTSTATNTTVNYDGFMTWVGDGTGGTATWQRQQQPAIFRYAWYGTDAQQPLTGTFAFKDYAPVDEMPLDDLKQWAKKLAEDPRFLQEQLEAQVRLFEAKNGADPLYEKYAGSSIYTRTIKSLRQVIGVIGRQLSGEEYTETVAKLKAHAKESEKRYKQLHAAEIKAGRLLKEWLSPAEYNYLKETGEVHVSSRLEPETIYIVNKHAEHKVVKRQKGKDVEMLCVVPDRFKIGGLPNNDGLLSKILLLKTREEEFVKLANITRLG